MLDLTLSHAGTPRLLRPDDAPVDWAVSAGLTDYPTAVEAMEARVARIAGGAAAELIWLVEHPPLYTAGVSAQAAELLDPTRFPVFRSGRGGRFTYHGPGQRVVYVMLDLAARGRDVRRFVQVLQAWIIAALAALEIEGFIREDRIGVWVFDPRRGEAKIAAIGVKLRRWVSFHGASLNVSPDLSHFAGIVPCGVTEHGVTSIEALKGQSAMAAVDLALRGSFERLIGPLATAGAPLPPDHGTALLSSPSAGM